MPVAAAGPTGQSGRYLQYQAELATTDTERTPLLRQVTIGYNRQTERPTILTPHAGHGATDVRAGDDGGRAVQRGDGRGDDHDGERSGCARRGL